MPKTMPLHLLKHPYKETHILPDTPDDFVYVQSTDFKRITGIEAGKNRTRPWRGRVVYVIYNGSRVLRLLHGHGNMNINANYCWFGNQTRSQLDIKVKGEVEVEVKAAPCQVLGRFLYYWDHTRDEVRFTYRLSIVALVFAVLALFIEIVNAYVSLQEKTGHRFDS